MNFYLLVCLTLKFLFDLCFIKMSRIMKFSQKWKPKQTTCTSSTDSIVISSSHPTIVSSSSSMTPMKRKQTSKSSSSPSNLSFIHMLSNEYTWYDLSINKTQFRPNFTLRMGQCFTWNRLDESIHCKEENIIWVGIIGNNIYAIKQDNETTYYSNLSNYITNEMVDDQVILYDYFQLHEDLVVLYQQWSNSCSRMKEIAKVLPGVRVIRQDPWECLVSFICSSCNNIKRITQMITSLKQKYGTYLGSLYPLKQSDNTITWSFTKEVKQEDILEDISCIDFYSFPTIEQVANINEIDLRELGFGYRAKFLIETAKILYYKQQNSINLLMDLRLLAKQMQENKNDIEKMKVIATQIQDELIQLPGVGRKVADCVALFSLDSTFAIPVDTHVWEIAQRDYGPHLLLTKSLTPKIYYEVRDLFIERFGEKAGWAHSILFAAELNEFRQLLPITLQDEMMSFKEERKQMKEKLKNSEKSTD